MYRVDDGAAGLVGPGPSSSTAGRLAIPAGEVYCAECHSMGAAFVLAGYSDKVDFESSQLLLQSRIRVATITLKKPVTICHLVHW